MSNDDRLAPGQTFGRYQIVRVLGEGGMGVVYEAIHPALKKRFAIKTLLPSVAELPSVRARFLREGEATSRIEHPHVVDVVDVGEQDGMPFLVMEFLEGENLADLLAAKGRLEIGDAVDILLPVMSAVAAAHAEGVVHRDLKPSNIFLARGPWGERFPKVLDFGISKLIDDGQSGVLTGTLTVLGTAAYMSPEQTRGAREIDGRSDQYSFGLILYESLTGRRPHDGDHALEVLHNIANGIFKTPRAVRPDLPEALEKVLLQMMALDPANRYRSLVEVGRALLPFAGEKARITLSDAFAREREAGVRPRQPAKPPGAVRPADPPASTTFREAAAELSVAGARPRRGLRMAAITLAGAVFAGAAGWVLVSLMPPQAAQSPKAAAPGPAASTAASPSAAPAPAAARPAEPEVPPDIPPEHVEEWKRAARATVNPVTAPLGLKLVRPPDAPPAGDAAAAPARRVHHKKAGHTNAAPAAPAHDAADSPKRGANNALIIK